MNQGVVTCLQYRNAMGDRELLSAFQTGYSTQILFEPTPSTCEVDALQN